MVVDTNIFIEYLRKQNKSKTTLANLPAVDLYYYSAITKFELFSGATDLKKWNEIEFLLAPMAELPFHDQIAIEAARIFQHLRKNGSMIEFRDIFIAASAIVNNLPLKTLNTKDFSRISGLALA